MPPVVDADAALVTLFELKPVVDLAELRRALATRSRTTVFRYLSRVGYYSSYSHAGRYYTLRHIPAFDDRGLWFHGEARFSAHGTLRATVVVLVKQAPAGYTHEELQQILGLRVHDTLRSLVTEGRIVREQVETVFVYADIDRERAVAQLAERRSRAAQEAPPAAPQQAPPLDSSLVIDVLVAVINHPDHSLARVARELQSHGVQLTETQVDRILLTYGVKKTARSRFKHSRRSGKLPIH